MAGAVAVVAIAAGLAWSHQHPPRVAPWAPPADAEQVLAASTFAPRTDMPTTALIVGDSYTAGAAGIPWTDTYALQACAKLKWACSLDAAGGTGFVNGRGDDRDYSGRLDHDAVTYKADWVVITGGRNDGAKGYSPQVVKKAVTGYIEEVRAYYPRARIVIVEPWWPDEDRPDELIELGRWEREAGRRVNADWIPTRHWLNHELIAEDGVHPSVQGHAILAAKLAKAIRSVQAS